MPRFHSMRQHSGRTVPRFRGAFRTRVASPLRPGRRARRRGRAARDRTPTPASTAAADTASTVGVTRARPGDAPTRPAARPAPTSITPSESSMPNAGDAQTGASSATRRTDADRLRRPTDDVPQRRPALTRHRAARSRAPGIRRARDRLGRAPWRPTASYVAHASNSGDFGSVKCGGCGAPSRARRRAAPRRAAVRRAARTPSRSRTAARCPACARGCTRRAARACRESSRRRYASFSASGFVTRAKPSPPATNGIGRASSSPGADERLANALRREPRRIVADGARTERAHLEREAVVAAQPRDLLDQIDLGRDVAAPRRRRDAEVVAARGRRRTRCCARSDSISSVAERLAEQRGDAPRAQRDASSRRRGSVRRDPPARRRRVRRRAARSDCATRSSARGAIATSTPRSKR